MKHINTYKSFASLTEATKPIDDEIGEIEMYLKDIFQELEDKGFKINVKESYASSQNRKISSDVDYTSSPIPQSYWQIRYIEIKVSISTTDLRVSGKNAKYREVEDYIISADDYMKSIGYNKTLFDIATPLNSYLVDKCDVDEIISWINISYRNYITGSIYK